MNAVVEEVSRMVVEDRITRVESDIAEVKGDLKTLIIEFRDFKSEVAKGFGSVRAELRDFKTEVAKEFGSVRAELRDFKTEVAKEFGSVRAEVAKEFGSVRSEFESLRTSIERTKLWMLGTGISTMLGVAALVLKLR